MKYLTAWEKRLQSEMREMEATLVQAKFKPNDIVYHGKHIFKVAYPEVRDDQLVYLVQNKKGAYWISEQALLASDQN